MAELGCSSNAAVAFEYFVGKGLTDFQAAAIVGNLQQESGVNPRNYPPSATAEQAYGVAAWHLDRWQGLQALANQTGRSPWTLDTQLDWIWEELPNYGLSELRASTTLEDATVAFQNLFEKCGNCRQDKRISYANAALYALQKCTPPKSASKAGLVAAVVGAFALVTAVGYSVFKLFGSREQDEEFPLPPPRPPIRPPPTIYRGPF